MGSGLLIAGTASDVGKSVITAGICRWLHRQGIRVAPFKAQNMSNNSVVALDTIGGGEIGRAQALQAAACGLEPSVHFNPVLLKPEDDHTSQVVVLGKVVGNVSATHFRSLQKKVREIAFDTLTTLQSEYDVVVCEGAGSPTEINLRHGDYVNMGLARKMNWPVLIVGDIDRGGVFASLYGTLTLLSMRDQRLIAGFIINKFRGDMGLLKPGLDVLEKKTGKRIYGVLPWRLNLWLDSEDSLAYGQVHGHPSSPIGDQWLRVAVVRLPHISNATDFDALAMEPGVQVRFTIDAGDIAAADLVILPGTKATVADLHWLQQAGLADTLITRARHQLPILGICGGFQMLAERIHDNVESKAGVVSGLGLLSISIRFKDHKTTTLSQGSAFGVIPVKGYEIHHGYVEHQSASCGPFIVSTDNSQEGARDHAIFGTHWHGIFESDDFRRAFLKEIAHLSGRSGFLVASDTNFTAEREHMLDTLGDLVESYLDTEALRQLVN